MNQENKKVTMDNSPEILDELDKITKKNRSHLVKEHDYGRIKSANATERDESVYAIIEYDANGQVVYEDYSKLEKKLNEVISDNIKETHIINPVTNQKEIAKTIQGNILTKLKLSEKEMEYAINYLTEKNILVRGMDSSLDNDFEGYQYTSTYKSETLPQGLTNQENAELFKKLNELKIKISKCHNKEEKQELEKEMYKIREKLIEGNMRLAAHIINKNIPSDMNEKDKEDIRQMGYESLIYFIDKYNVNKGYALSTGLYNYLMLKIWRNYEDEKLMRIPVHQMDRIRKIMKIKEVIEPILEREVTPEEIAGELYIPVEQVVEALNICRTKNIESIEALEYDTPENEQLYDSKLDEEEMFEYEEIDTLTENLPELIGDNNLLKEGLEEILDTLTERERDVLKIRYGFYDGRTYTLDEVAEMLGLTRERIRQIENKAIRKLRHPSRAKIVRDFYVYDSEDRYTINNVSHKR